MSLPSPRLPSSAVTGLCAIACCVVALFTMVAATPSAGEELAWIEELTRMRQEYAKLDAPEGADEADRERLAARLLAFLGRYPRDYPDSDQDNRIRSAVETRLASTRFTDTLVGGAAGPELVIVRPGTFTMGDSEGDDNERPVRGMTIGYAFAVAVHETTFDEYDRFALAADRRAPSDHGWGRGSRPVVDVSWEEAAAYAAWLATRTGKPYRLLSEAEWEYVARAGSAASYSFGDSVDQLCEHGNGADRSTRLPFRNVGCRDDFGKMTAPVGQFRLNAFGVADMHGNVLEWVGGCATRDLSPLPGDGQAYHEDECKASMMRGGSWRSGPFGLRAAARSQALRTDRYAITGFRVARDLSR